MSPYTTRYNLWHHILLKYTYGTINYLGITHAIIYYVGLTILKFFAYL